MQGAGGYRVIRNGERSNGGIMPFAVAGLPAEAPAAWLPYFGHEDTDAGDRARARRSAGRSCHGPMEVPAGTFAVVADAGGRHVRGPVRRLRRLARRARRARPGPLERQHASRGLAHAGAERGRAARDREQGCDTGANEPRPVSSTRSAPARTARSDTVAMSPVAIDARASIESVITTPRNPSRRRSRPSMIAGDCEAMWSGSSAG